TNRNKVCLGRGTGFYRYITTGFNNTVERSAVYYQIFNYRKCRCAGRLNGDLVTIFIMAHMQLANCNALHGAMCLAINHKVTGTTNTLAAVVIEFYGFFSSKNKLLIQHIQHFKEGHVLINIIEG